MIARGVLVEKFSVRLRNAGDLNIRSFEGGVEKAGYMPVYQSHDSDL